MTKILHVKNAVGSNCALGLCKKKATALVVDVNGTAHGVCKDDGEMLVAIQPKRDAPGYCWADGTRESRLF